MTSNEIEYDRSVYEALSKLEVALREGVTERTIETRLKTGYYKTIGEKKTLRILFPKTPKTIDLTPIPIEASLSEVEILRKENETLRNQIVELSKTITETVTKRDDTITTLNNQLTNAHHALAKRNLPEVIDPNTAVIEELRKEIESLRRRAPWWKVWK